MWPSTHDKMTGDVRSTGTARAVVYGVCAVAGKHGRDSFRRPPGSDVGWKGGTESRGCGSDDRDSGVARSEDARQPDGGRTAGARAGPVRAPPAICRGIAPREAHY